MKRKSLFLILGLLLLSLLFVNIKVAQSSYFQAYLMYDFNEDSLRPYFKSTNVMKGVFEVAKKMYGLDFVK